MKAFQQEKGTYLCRELLKTAGPEQPVPALRDDVYYASRPCAQIVQTACEIVEKHLMTKE